MAVLEIALEIGTSFTSVFLSGNGIVLREPTVIAFFGDPKNKKIRAVGQEAYDMLGKTPDKTTIVSPVADGVISDPAACALLLTEFIKKILPQSFIFFPRIKAILGIPMGLSLNERKMYEDVVLNSFVKEVTMVENIMLSAIGVDLPIGSHFGGLIANIGGGTTEVAAIALSGIIDGCGVTLGGNLMDNAIIDYVAGRHNLKIGLSTARKIKTDIGTLYENDLSDMTVNGIDISTKTIANAKIKASEIYNVLRPYYIRIRDAIESIINMLPPEIASDVKKSGLYICGGASLISGLDKFMSEELGIKTFIREDPSHAAILGAGKLLSNVDLLEELLTQK